MKRAVAFACAAATILSCGGGPSLPRDVTYEGEALKKAGSWSSGKVSGVVFVRPGESLETASLQVGLIASREHHSGAELHRWVMEQYRSSPTQRWYESDTADEACKVGLPPGLPPRPFLALHVCRSGKGAAGCAEADERLDDDTMRGCRHNADCWDELCRQKWKSRRESLEALVVRLVGTR